MRILALALASALSAGCSNNAVHGKVAGFHVPLKSAFLLYTPPQDGGDGIAVVTMSSLPSACPVYDYWFEQLEQAETPEELAQGWADAFPEQFWEVLITARMDGDGWPVPRTRWQGVAWDQLLEEPNRAFATLIQHNGHRPPEWFEGLEGYEQKFYSNAGVVTWRKVVPEQRLAGSFQTLTVDEEGVDAGPIEIEFDATPCPQVGFAGAGVTDTGAR